MYKYRTTSFSSPLIHPQVSAENEAFPWQQLHAVQNPLQPSTDGIHRLVFLTDSSLSGTNYTCFPHKFIAANRAHVKSVVGKMALGYFGLLCRYRSMNAKHQYLVSYHCYCNERQRSRCILK
jgi:hypothetical protein